MDDDANLDHDAALAEFAALRAEILARNGHQHTMMGLNLTISGAVFSFALTQPSRLLALLVVPFTAFMIGGRYIAQDYGVTTIGGYLREHLSRRVVGGLGWEAFIHQNRAANRTRLYFGLDPLFIAFPGIATAALAFCARPVWLSLSNASVQGVLTSVVWIAGLLLVAISFRNVWRIRRHFILADWSRRAGGPAVPKPSSTPEELKVSD
jgi:hypothetical protein